MMLNPLSPELNPICYLLALLAHDFLNVSRIGVKSLTLRLLMLYIYIYDISILRVNLSFYRIQTRRNDNYCLFYFRFDCPDH
jgi:transposase